MATLVIAVLCLLSRKCTKRIKQEFLDTAFNWKPSLSNYGKFSKIL